MRAWFDGVLYGLGFVLLVATGLRLVRKNDWWIRIFDFPRLQITALTGVVLAGVLWVRPGSDDRALVDDVFLALLALSLTGKYAPYKQGFGPFAGEVHRRARAARTVVHLAGIGLHVGDELLHRLGRHRRMHDERERTGAQQAFLCKTQDVARKYVAFVGIRHDGDYEWLLLVVDEVYEALRGFAPISSAAHASST